MIYKGVDIEIHGGSVIPQDDIYMSGMSVSKSISGAASLSLGAVGGSNFDFSMNNTGKWKTFPFREKLIYVGYDGDNIGAFEVAEAKRNIGVINIDSYGISTRLDRSYAFSSTKYPTTLKNVVEDIGKDLNIVVDSNFLNNGLTVNLESKNLYSYRDIFGFAAAIGGGYGMVDNTNKLVIRTYHKNFQTPKNVENDIKNISIGEELTITGVVWYDKDNNSILKGTTDNLLLVPNNPFIESLNHPESFITYLGDIYIGMKYNPVDLDLYFRADIEPGDVIYGEGFKTIVMSVVGSIGGNLNITTTGRSTTDYYAMENQQLI